MLLGKNLVNRSWDLPRKKLWRLMQDLLRQVILIVVSQKNIFTLSNQKYKLSQPQNNFIVWFDTHKEEGSGARRRVVITLQKKLHEKGYNTSFLGTSQLSDPKLFSTKFWQLRKLVI